jgi:hypothetical protein
VNVVPLEAELVPWATMCIRCQDDAEQERPPHLSNISHLVSALSAPKSDEAAGVAPEASANLFMN